jgi:hypothetical protein
MAWIILLAHQLILYLVSKIILFTYLNPLYPRILYLFNNSEGINFVSWEIESASINMAIVNSPSYFF